MNQKSWQVVEGAAALIALLALSTGSAQAQGFPTEGGRVDEVPRLSSDLFRPSVDAQRLLWTDEANNPGRNAKYLRVSAYMVNRPFVWEWEDGEVEPIVANALGVPVSFGYGLGPARVGLTVPIYLWSNGDLQSASGAALGDPSVDARVVVLQRTESRPGVGFVGRLGIPLGGANKQLGHDGVSWELGAVADYELGPVLVAANLGTRGVPVADLGDIELNDALWYKLGVGYEVREATGFTAELAGGSTYQAFFAPLGSPLELQLGFYVPVARGMAMRAFGGTGLTSGVGSPSWRAGLSFFYFNDPSQDTDLDGIPDSVDACPEAPEDYDDWQDQDGCPEWDNDEDGYVDTEDACPIDPEDFDQYEDRDGCPEGNARVTVELVTPDGQPVPMPRIKLIPRVGDPTEFVKTPSTTDLASGPWLLEVSAEGMLPLQKSFDVPEEGALLLREVMQPEAVEGTLVVRILDPAGGLLPGTWKLDDLSYEYGATGGVGRREVPAGRHVVTARAPNFAPGRVEVDVPAKGEIEVVVVLSPSKVKISRERIDVNGKIYFEFDSAEIKPESFPLLDEVAQTLIDHPELLRLRIEGHTDNKGSDDYNLKLSDARALSVMNYLVIKGVDPDRLESQGFGESQPIADNNTEAGREKNRRVVFLITERSDD